MYILGCYTIDGSMRPVWLHYFYDGIPCCMPNRKQAQRFDNLDIAIQYVKYMVEDGMERVFIEDITSEMEKYEASN